ncbi:PREDICTED: stathmin-2-B-like [Branchiostoma belcheri]|uniref:Stathmin n=1 Tax=Branchiostoma belcheri TaxID=7741 RepID=A0A6P5A5X8_BRABE|nr:PREDICTED: stathmin-2-B-like [Branchiostoma belcheri]XP_019641674.1 PREDICTED: stathmin-2-B-like [Branchiostoma belcheri]
MDVKQEKRSSGGQAFEIVLGDAAGPPPRPSTPAKSPRSVTQEDITRKMQEAEDRRKARQSQIMEKLQQEDQKRDEVLKRAAEVKKQQGDKDDE